MKLLLLIVRALMAESSSQRQLDRIEKKLDNLDDQTHRLARNSVAAVSLSIFFFGFGLVLATSGWTEQQKVTAGGLYIAVAAVMLVAIFRGLR